MTARSIFVGVDLSGPSNHADTACAVFEEVNAQLVYVRHLTNLADADILHLLSGLRGSSLTVGLDAPLSYQDGGGDRPSDRALRQLLRQAGMPSGSVMTPTMTRMAYLTLRGIHLSRQIQDEHPESAITEVHPFGSLVLAGGPVESIREVKQRAEARAEVLSWLSEAGMQNLPGGDVSDHELAAFGAAFGAWQWQRGKAAWQFEAELPHHPFAFVS